MVCAIHLAARGNNVEIYEKNFNPGGKMNEFRKDGFRFDTGPSLITMPYVFEEFFNSIEKKMSDYFELTKIENACRYFWNDGTVFNAYTDEKELIDELTDVFGEQEMHNYFRYLDYGKLFYDLSKDSFLGSEFSLKNFITKDGIFNFTKFISGRSINDVSNKFLKDGRLKQLMNRFATYNGSSPYLAPQFFSIIPYVENKFGAWYVKGGIYSIAKSLEKLCREFNVEINYGCSLENAGTDKKNITSLTFDSAQGKIVRENDFDAVISNFTSNKVFSGDYYFRNDDWSSSGFIMMLGMNRQYPEFSHHNILFSENYEREFIDIFENKIPADDMTIYISISSKDEINDAPAGCENWFVLVNVPFMSDKFIWDEGSTKIYSEKIIDRIDNFLYPSDGSIRNHILFNKIFTPIDFLKSYNSERGSIYGLSSNSLYTLLKRPGNKSDLYSNLYFTGGNTHPGGGVPLCFLSGKIVSEYF